MQERVYEITESQMAQMIYAAVKVALSEVQATPKKRTLNTENDEVRVEDIEALLSGLG